MLYIYKYKYIYWDRPLKSKRIILLKIPIIEGCIGKWSILRNIYNLSIYCVGNIEFLGVKYAKLKAQKVNKQYTL
jgi:hypothetical protein